MGFAAPWFLAGLGTLALPLYLHLLKRHKSTPQQFSSLMFFERSTEADLMHRRLDYLTLLACRLALLAFIIFAFASPFILRTGPALPGKVRLVVIDVSASMAANDRIAAARSQAKPLLGEGVKLAALDSRLRFTNPLELDSLRAGPSRSSFGELARALKSYSEELKRPLEVHFFSDLQRTSMPDGFRELGLATGTTLVLHPLAESADPNWAVESVAAPSRVRDPKTAKVKAVIAAFHAPASAKKVTLEVNGRAAGSQTVQVPADGRATVEFTGLDLPYGFSKCAVKIEGGDNLSADDRYLFAIQRTDPQRILFAFGPAAAQSALFFREALEAAAPGAYRVDATPIDRLQAGALDGAAFVVLSDPGSVKQGLEAALNEYVASGGSIFITLGAATAATSRVPVTGEAIRNSIYTSRDADRYQVVGSADETNPALAKAGRWAGVRFYRYAVVDPKASVVVARLTDQTPILLERRTGAGKVVVLATALDNVSSDFPVQPAFVPFVEQLALRLSGWEEAATNAVVDAQLEVGAGGAPRAFEVLGPEGRRAVSLEESARGAPVMADRDGFWEIRRGSGRDQMIAVNVDRRESDLEPISQESAQLWAGGVAETGPAAGGAGEQTRRSLSIAAIAFALLSACAETWVGSKYLARRAA